MNGGMSEAKARQVDWSDVDEDTFARLCEFAYFGNYTPPKCGLVDGKVPPTKGPVIVKEKKETENKLNVNGNDSPVESATTTKRRTEPKAPHSDEEDAKDDFDDPEIPYKEKSIRYAKLRGALEMCSERCKKRQPGSHLNYNFKPPKNSGSWEDFTPVFLEQARLYVLADKYCIDSLCELVVTKLHQTLKSFRLYDTGVNGIIELVRFVYNNTPDYGREQIDGLRDLVTCYVVSVLGQIGEKECFKELLEEGGPFVSDMWSLIWEIEEGAK
ncbi:hypothetical protein N7535_000370 [Penicillium sp. DV-2018c]|nr:hypothetical protein N7461_006384 [Penicillium sp. DV-2018c]KAJ5581750.1 hypothetical protein N7535_000370 [Penicillium sp. DV-2018c]